MSKTSYYDIFGINQNAGKDEIKSAFRRLALKYHPDKNPNTKNAESIFIIISNAYQILINDDTRRGYDTFINKGRNKDATMAQNNKTYNPIISKTLSEFNYLLWDIDDVLKKVTDKNIAFKAGGSNLYDCLMRLFRYLEESILNDNSRFLNYANKKDKIRLHLENYFSLIRIEIDEHIKNLEIDLNSDKIRKLMKIKNDTIKIVGEIYNNYILD